MKLKLKKANNQIYIVDADAEINAGDLVILGSDQKLHVMSNLDMLDYLASESNATNKVIATPEQIDIDNLWDKYLEAMTEKENIKYYTDLIGEQSAYNYEFKDGYLQAKRETCFSDQDLSKAWSEGYHRKVDEIRGNELKYCNTFIQQLKLSKIPECGVEIEMESVLERSEYGMPNSNLLYCFPTGIFVSKPKLTSDKVTITKIIL